MLDRPAPTWLVETCAWIAGRWLCPRGLAAAWSFGAERIVRQIFDEPRPPVKWAHLLGRSWRRDAETMGVA